MDEILAKSIHSNVLLFSTFFRRKISFSTVNAKEILFMKQNFKTSFYSFKTFQFCSLKFYFQDIKKIFPNNNHNKDNNNNNNNNNINNNDNNINIGDDNENENKEEFNFGDEDIEVKEEKREINQHKVFDDKRIIVSGKIEKIELYGRVSDIVRSDNGNITLKLYSETDNSLKYNKEKLMTMMSLYQLTKNVRPQGVIRSKETGFTLPLHLTDELHEKNVHSFNAFEKAVLQNNFVASPSKYHCSHCIYSSFCPFRFK